jgi:hypothetical protein
MMYMHINLIHIVKIDMIVIHRYKFSGKNFHLKRGERRDDARG